MFKLYVLIKDGYSVAYQGVQGAHAVAQYMIENPDNEWQNETLVFLECNNFHKYRSKMKYTGKTWTEFKEPDLGNEVTAMACYADTSIFKTLKLIGT